MDCATQVCAPGWISQMPPTFSPRPCFQVCDAALNIVRIRHRMRIQADDDLASASFKAQFNPAGMLRGRLSTTAICRSGWESEKAAISARVPSVDMPSAMTTSRSSARKGLRVDGFEQFTDGILLVITGNNNGNRRHAIPIYSAGSWEKHPALSAAG